MAGLRQAVTPHSGGCAVGDQLERCTSYGWQPAVPVLVSQHTWLDARGRR
jgi:hypothetical protein